MQVKPAGEYVHGNLYWQGSLTQSMTMELGGQMLNALKDCDALTVNLDGVEFLDFSCLVLLCSVKRQASEKGKELSLTGVENPVVVPVIKRFRINGNRLCRTYCGNSCLFE